MMTATYDQITELTPAEEQAARAYTSSSALMHHLIQGHDAFGCREFDAKLLNPTKQLPLVASATKKFKLSAPTTLFSGYANGYSIVGGLWESDPEQFIGMTYKYHGFFSTSVDRAAAVRFLEAGPAPRYSVLLIIHASAGLLGLPAKVLGPDNVHEGEFLVAPKTPFKIERACHKSDRRAPYLELELSSIPKE